MIVMLAVLASPAIAPAADAPRRPNIVIILGGRLGIRRHGRVRRRDQDAEPRLAGEQRRALHQLLHPCELLAHAIDAAQWCRYPPEWPGHMDEWIAPNQRGVVVTKATSTNVWPRCRSCSRRPVITPTWSASGTWARRPTRSRRPGIRARLLAARRRRQLLGHDEHHRRRAEVGLHRGWPLPDQASRGLLRDQDLHRQADQLHRRQPGQWASPSSPTWRTRRRTTRTTCRGTGATGISANTTRAGTRCARSG